MNSVRLLDLGTVSPLRSQTVYHAVAHAMTEETPDTLLLVSPSDPYVCVGFHQDLEKEVELEFCRAHNLPVYRRAVGGGAVYLDGGQVFVQWIFHPGRLPVDLDSRFALYVQPLIDTYRALGIDAYYRPINDIHVGGRKIGGTGAATMGIADVVVGSLMFTFDKQTMARVLKVSSEKMRDKIVESLEQYMATMQDLLGTPPERDVVKSLYIQKCAAVLGVDIVPGTWMGGEETVAIEWDDRFVSDDWLFQRGGLRPVGVKIHEDVRVVEGVFKAAGGLIRVTARIRGGRLDDITFSGDFTLLPSLALAAMEEAVRGAPPNGDAVTARIREVYHAFNIQSPGITPQDFSRTISAALAP